MRTMENNESEQTAFLAANTNEVLVQEKKDKIFYYLPCYVRTKVKTVKEFQVQKLSGIVSATLLFGFYYGDLPENILSQFTGEGSKSIILQFPRQQSLELREGPQITVKEDTDNKIIDYVVRKQFDCVLEGDVVYTPFDIFNLYLSITVQTIVLNPKPNNGKSIHIKFNCMKSETVQTIDTGSSLEFGSYTLANYFVDSDYSNDAHHRYRPISVMHPDQRIEKSEYQAGSKSEGVADAFKGFEEHQNSNVKIMTSPATIIKEPKNKIEVQVSRSSPEKEKKLKNFQYVHFRIPLYKNPLSSLLALYVPMWVLAFINLAVYYQTSNVLADKVATIATVTLAFVAFLPTVNDNIPQRGIKLIEIIIYVQIGTTILTLIDSLQNRNMDPTVYETTWTSNPYFMITLIINIICAAIFLWMSAAHLMWWQFVYTKKRVARLTGKLCREQWGNKQCDAEFKKMIVAGKIVPVTSETQQVRVTSEEKQKFA